MSKYAIIVAEEFQSEHRAIPLRTEIHFLPLSYTTKKITFMRNSSLILILTLAQNFICSDYWQCCVCFAPGKVNELYSDLARTWDRWPGFKTKHGHGRRMQHNALLLLAYVRGRAKSKGYLSIINSKCEGQRKKPKHTDYYQ